MNTKTEATTTIKILDNYNDIAQYSVWIAFCKKKEFYKKKNKLVRNIKLIKTSVNKRTVNSNDCVVLKEEKDSSKDTREIPLISISKAILLKYNYKLPLVSNQKQNDYIKEVLKEAGFVHEVEYSKTKGVEQEVFVKKFYERISTHTARRIFITIMRNKGIADKTIMSISGHKDIKTFNMYHQVNNDAKIHAVKSVFENF